jgi:hypothetical protein
MFLKPQLDDISLQATYERKAKDIDDDNSWIYWTVVCMSAVVGCITAFVLYECICRVKDRLSTQQIYDGGPPATPTHSFTYTVGVRADKASPSFDTQISVIKIELLDRFNRYVTTVAVPCFLFKFKEGEGPPAEKPDKPVHPVFIRTMTVLQEQWSSTRQSELVTFQFTRRKPLTDIASARIGHDCFAKEAYITLKYIAFHDPLADIHFMINLKDQRIKATHPCPPSMTQVFSVDKLTTPNDDIKSFLDQMSGKNSTWCTPCWKGDTTAHA